LRHKPLRANVVAHGKSSLETKKMKTETRWILRSDRPTSILTVACIATAVLIAAVWPSARIPGVVTKVHAQDRVCSVASLQGAYAFRRTGVNNGAGGATALIGVDIFNGDGTRGLLRRSGSLNGQIQDWTDVFPGGSYTVDADCTGSIFDASGTKTNNFVVLDGGKGFFLISTLPGTIVTSEGNRLELEN
jgi:hypothetical protein